MTAVDERTSIGNLFDLHWANRVRVSWPNAEFTPGAEESYVVFSVMRGDSDRIEIGTEAKYRRAYGRVYLQVFVPRGTGDNEARRLCDEAEAIFREHSQLTLPSGARVLFREPVTRPIGAAGAHYQMNVSIPYQFDSL